MSTITPIANLEERLRHLSEENARLAHENARVRRMAATMRDASIALGESLDLDEVLETLLDFLSDLIPMDSGAIMLLENEEELLAMKAVRGFSDPQHQLSVCFKVSEIPHLAHVIHAGIPHAIPDRGACSTWKTLPGDSDIQSWLGIPLVSRGRVIGCYSLNANTPHRFHEGHIRIAEILATQAAVAIDNAQCFEQSNRDLSDAKRGSDVKSWSITAVSSQLRTPLSSIAGFAELWLEQSHRLPTELVTDLGHMLTASQHATLVIQQLRDLSAIEQGQIQIRRATLSPRTLVQDLLWTLRPLADQHHNVLVLSGEPPASAVGDAFRIRTVLSHLLDNACRYTRGGRVTVEVSTFADSLRFRVQDNGIGLPPPHHTPIFDAFVRGEQAGLSHPNGSGLGLCLARQLARAMGGEVLAGGLPGLGATFDFTVPNSRAE